MAGTFRPIRILFILVWPLAGDEEAQIRLLARTLDPRQYRITIVACLPEPGMPDQARRQLEGPGIDIDRVPDEFSFEDTVGYLAQKIPAHDVIVSCRNAAHIYPALEKLHWRPPLIELGDPVPEASAGPRPFTSRYIDLYRGIPGAAASSGTGRGSALRERVRLTQTADAAAPRWRALFAQVLRERKPAPAPSSFASFIQGGFECSTHKRGDGRRLDLLAATGHDEHAAADYAQLAAYGMSTVRDGLRWHLIEPRAGRYDWSSFLPMLRAARTKGTQVVWDLMHYGWPDDLDIWSPAFVDRFTRFAAAAATIIRSETDEVPFYCPINEISFLAWGGGDAAYLNPFARGRGFELKAQLARAAISAMHAILAVDPRARFVHCEPAINIVADPSRPLQRREAEGARLAQFQAFDMIAGRLWPQLGGEMKLLDIVGLNYYRNNQWVLDGPQIAADHPESKPFRYFLAETYARYGRPLLVAETGTEGHGRAAWFSMMTTEVEAARAAGVPVEGLCLYPIIDHFGWDDDRNCPSGLLSSRVANGRREVHAPLAEAIERWQSPDRSSR